MNEFKKPLSSHPICGACRWELLYDDRWNASCTNPKCQQCNIVVDTLTGEVVPQPEPRAKLIRVEARD